MQQRQIREVMTPNPRALSPDATVAEAARLMKEEDVGLVPLVEGGRLVGTATDRDIAIRVVAEGKDPQSVSLRDIASTDLATIDPQQDLAEAVEAEPARVGETIEEISK